MTQTSGTEVESEGDHRVVFGLISLMLSSSTASCTYGSDLFVPVPELPAGTESIFYGLVENGGRPRVSAAAADGAPHRLALLDGDSELEEVFAFPESLGLETQGLESGPLVASRAPTARALDPRSVVSFSFREGGDWKSAVDRVPSALLSFRFDALGSPSPCARVEPLVSWDVGELGGPDAVPVRLLPLDAEHVVAFPSQPAFTALVLSSTASTVIDLGIPLVTLNSRRAVLRRRSGSWVVGGPVGQVWTGTVGQSFVLTATVPSTVAIPSMGPAEDDRWAGFFETETTDRRLMGLSDHRLWDLSRSTGVPFFSSPLLEAQTPASSAMQAAVAPIGDGTVLVAFAKFRTIYRIDLSEASMELRPVHVDDAGTLTTLAAVPGGGVFAGTSLGEVLRWDPETSSFESFTVGLRSLNAADGWMDSLFFLTRESWTQFVGTEECTMSHENVAESDSNLAVFGNFLGLSGRQRGKIEIYRLSEATP